MSQTAKYTRLAAVARAFRPGAPVSELDMLAGRKDQLMDIVNAVSMAGQHVGLYGERGVGKTSLANVLAEFFRTELGHQFDAVLVNCATDDTFHSLWRTILAELDVDDEVEISPEAIRRVLQDREMAALIVVDELDRLEDDEALTAMADTIKTLSDHAVPSTLVQVGVARSIGELVGEHASIVRNLVQIKMPRMSKPELAEILLNGCDAAELSMRRPAIDEVVTLSEGLPHYTHLLGLHSAQRAVQDDRDEVTLADVQAAIPKAIERHTIEDAYQQATRSARRDALFGEVLLACALAPKNPLGYFTSGSIREPLELIAGRRIEIPAFSNHMSQFLEPERGSVLQREGSKRRYFYRFTDPIFQPYVILSGLKDGLITDEQRRQFQDVEETAELTVGDFEPNEPQPLF